MDSQTQKAEFLNGVLFALMGMEKSATINELQAAGFDAANQLESTIDNLFHEYNRETAPIQTKQVNYEDDGELLYAS